MKYTNFEYFAGSADAWLENFPEQYRNNLASYDKKLNQTIKEEQSIKTMNAGNTSTGQNVENSILIQNAHLQDANRHYANRQMFDRRRNRAAEENNINNRRKGTKEKAVIRRASLRDNQSGNEYFRQDAFDVRNLTIQNNKSSIPPMHIEGLEYNILISDKSMMIGCIERSIEQWLTLSDREIMEMDGKNGLVFWRENKEMIIAACKAHLKKLEKI